MAQLQLWNPELLDDCSNLRLDDAYCVNGDAGGSSSAPVRARAWPTAAAAHLHSHQKRGW
jgi:hypothetical protein